MALFKIGIASSNPLGALFWPGAVIFSFSHSRASVFADTFRKLPLELSQAVLASIVDKSSVGGAIFSFVFPSSEQVNCDQNYEGSLPPELFSGCASLAVDSLRTIQMGLNYVGDNFLLALSASRAAPSLKSLSVKCCLFTDAASSSWSKFASIEKLDLSDARLLGSASVLALSQVASLRKIRLYGMCRRVHYADAIAMLLAPNVLPLLRKLRVQSGVSLQRVVEHLFRVLSVRPNPDRLQVLGLAEEQQHPFPSLSTVLALHRLCPNLQEQIFLLPPPPWDDPAAQELRLLTKHRRHFAAGGNFSSIRSIATGGVDDGFDPVSFAESFPFCKTVQVLNKRLESSKFGVLSNLSSLTITTRMGFVPIESLPVSLKIFVYSASDEDQTGPFDARKSVQTTLDAVGRCAQLTELSLSVSLSSASLRSLIDETQLKNVLQALVRLEKLAIRDDNAFTLFWGPPRPALSLSHPKIRSISNHRESVFSIRPVWMPGVRLMFIQTLQGTDPSSSLAGCPNVSGLSISYFEYGLSNVASILSHIDPAWLQTLILTCPLDDPSEEAALHSMNRLRYLHLISPPFDAQQLLDSLPLLTNFSLQLFQNFPLPSRLTHRMLSHLTLSKNSSSEPLGCQTLQFNGFDLPNLRSFSFWSPCTTTMQLRNFQLLACGVLCVGMMPLDLEIQNCPAFHRLEVRDARIHAMSIVEAPSLEILAFHRCDFSKLSPESLSVGGAGACEAGSALESRKPSISLEIDRYCEGATEFRAMLDTVVLPATD